MKKTESKTVKVDFEDVDERVAAEAVELWKFVDHFWVDDNTKVELHFQRKL